MKTKPATEYALLGAVMKAPRHGYEILQFLNSTLGSTWHVGTSQLYTLLKKLEARGLLDSCFEKQETRPSRRIFSLTSEGRRAFLDWLHRPTQHVRDVRIEFLAKLFFFRRLSLEGADKIIEAQIRVFGKTGERLKDRQEKTADPYEKLALGFKTATLEAWHRWLVQEAMPFIRENRDALQPLTGPEPSTFNQAHKEQNSDTGV